MSELIEVVIDRKKWYRGLNSGVSALLIGPERVHDEPEAEGKMCCLGFTALACGISREKITDRPTPSSLIGKYPLSEDNPFLKLFVSNPMGTGRDLQSNSCDRMISTNDDSHIDDKKRESILTDEAEQTGFKFTFIN